MVNYPELASRPPCTLDAWKKARVSMPKPKIDTSIRAGDWLIWRPNHPAVVAQHGEVIGLLHEIPGLVLRIPQYPFDCSVDIAFSYWDVLNMDMQWNRRVNRASEYWTQFDDVWLSDIIRKYTFQQEDAFKEGIRRLNRLQRVYQPLELASTRSAAIDP